HRVISPGPRARRRSAPTKLRVGDLGSDRPALSSPAVCGMSSPGWSVISRFTRTITLLVRGCLFRWRPRDTEAREAFGLVIAGPHVEDDGGLRLDVGITQSDIEQGAVMVQDPALHVGADIFECLVSKQGRDERVECLGQIRVASRFPQCSMD